jgi:5-dehydro-4-deoxyglucarate dehydratase
MTKLRDQLRGVVGFPITPFHDDLSVDYAALESNVAHMAGFEFCSQVAAGGTGELYSLTPGEAVEIVRVAKQAAGKMPIIGGVGVNVPWAIEAARGMERAGADALLILPPYYTNSPWEGLAAYYEAIGKATGLPLAIYSRDWAVFTPQMVAQLAERIPTLDIWKDGQGNGRVYQRIMSHVGDRLAWIGGLGDDCLPTYLSVGVQAFTSSISNTAPQLAVDLARAGGLIPGSTPDWSRVTDLMTRFVHPVYAARERIKGYEVAAMKFIMDNNGHGAKGGPVRPPLQNVHPDHQSEFRRIIEIYQQAGY